MTDLTLMGSLHQNVSIAHIPPEFVAKLTRIGPNGRTWDKVIFCEGIVGRRRAINLLFMMGVNPEEWTILNPSVNLAGRRLTRIIAIIPKIYYDSAPYRGAFDDAYLTSWLPRLTPEASKNILFIE